MCEKTEQICEGQGPSQAALDVLAERRRQIDVEGWSAEHDDAHDRGEMAKAAACYALQTRASLGLIWLQEIVDRLWPWSREWWKPGHNARRMLVKAAALLIAEIERLDRKAARDAEGRS